jgi:hypothetical protein
MKHSILLPQRAYQAFLGKNQTVVDSNQWQALKIQGPSAIICAAHDAYLDEIEIRLFAAAKVLVDDLAQAIRSKDTHQFMQASITLSALINLCRAITNETEKANPALNLAAMVELNNIPTLTKPETLLKHFHFFPLNDEQSPLINETDLAWYLDLFESTMKLQANEIRQIKTAGDEAIQCYPHGVNVFDAFTRFHIETRTSTPALSEHDNSRTKATKNETPKITYEDCSNFTSLTILNCPSVIESLSTQQQPTSPAGKTHTLQRAKKNFLKKNTVQVIRDCTSANTLYTNIERIITKKYQPTSALGKRYLNERVTSEVNKQFTHTTNGPKITSPLALEIDNVATRCRQLDELSSDLTAYRDECAEQNKTTYQAVATEAAIQSKKDLSNELLTCSNNANPRIPVSSTIEEMRAKLLIHEKILAQQPKTPSQKVECCSLSMIWQKLKSLCHNATSYYYDAKNDYVNRDAHIAKAENQKKSFTEAKLYCRLFPPAKTAPVKPKPWLDPDKSKHPIFRRL